MTRNVNDFYSMSVVDSAAMYYLANTRYFISYIYIYATRFHIAYTLTVYNLALSSKQFFGDVPTPNVVEAGSFCQVDGLQSDAGKKLNGQRCSVKRYVKKDTRTRYK